MDNPIQNAAEMAELNHDKSYGSPEITEMNDERTASIKDPDTMLSMIVLLLTCLALAALAHAVV